MKPRPLAAITGASSGIGKEFARQCAKGGYDVLLIARRKDLLEGLAADLHASFGVSAEVLAADLSEGQDCQMVAEHLRRSAHLELLVNNAGFILVGEFSRLDANDQERMHRLHVLATLSLTHAALHGMLERDRGAIINVSSLSGMWLYPGMTSYIATKHWMNTFSEGLHLELRQRASSVRVQALCPGYTRSEIFESAGLEGKRIQAHAWMEAEDVVAVSLRSLRGHKVLVVPGWRNQVALFVYRAVAPLLPRHLRPKLLLALL